MSNRTKIWSFAIALAVMVALGAILSMSGAVQAQTPSPTPTPIGPYDGPVDKDAAAATEILEFSISGFDVAVPTGTEPPSNYDPDRILTAIIPTDDDAEGLFSVGIVIAVDDQGDEISDANGPIHTGAITITKTADTALEESKYEFVVEIEVDTDLTDDGDDTDAGTADDVDVEYEAGKSLLMYLISPMEQL